MEKVIDPAKYTKELSKLIASSDNILIICHINPDGDAIGSQLALFHYLTSKGRHVDMISPNNLQEFLKWMPGADQIRIFIRQRAECIALIKQADLIIMTDFSHPGRLGEAEKYVISSGAKKVIIDHHLDPADFTDLTISDPSKCATTELVYELITLMDGVPYTDNKFSECIYVGIISDTGNFDHGALTGRTFRIVADLLDNGINREKMINVVFNNYSADRMRLMGLALNKRMVIIPELKTAYIYLTRRDLTDFNHVKGDTEGFVNLPLSIRDIVFSVLFIEKENHVKISFRSKGNFPVNKFASEYFSGGGHMNASGGEYYENLDNTIAYFLRILNDNAALIKNATV
ncbi:MAG TPA: bifunctional oligoribonuclease/PAP phosphatase NrnA [Bacteroidales bacterium]|nr:bifunctional oligoribonuclease/PAP phosphatase NrnA [Bacteroidales bacterium]HNR42126.1 bifunctional oligoribonuclease/PAP phosphatase NrnA [Bacteroidales bacterium]HPM18712.1 bifunctional oligoribonuclease/PAP phosphatase NrnA [Bacteroidales bacterium]HQG77526.1 bifunctional oligoribonuclease/PAP phosphatase NrnA [Bacteroidales bacterium]